MMMLISLITHHPLDALAQYAGLSERFFDLRVGGVSNDAALILSPTAHYRGAVGHLVTISDAADDALLKWITGTGIYWMGISRKLGSSADLWVYNAGPSVGVNISYSNWYPGFPSVSSNACAFIDGVTGRWFDAACNASLGYIVEFECPFGFTFGESACIG